MALAGIALSACAVPVQRAPAPAAQAPAAQAPAATAAPAKLKVFAAYATPLEEPWPSIIHAALNAEKDAGNIDYRFQDNIGYKGDMDKVIRKEIEENKPNIIMGDAFGNEEIVAKAAKDNPDVAFVFGMPGGPANPNLSVFDNWIHEPAYLSGLIAGKLTENNKIGVVAAMPIPEVNRIVNGFIQGAKETNPDVDVSVSYINSFFDPAQAKEAALAQVAAGADVLFAERFGVIEAAKEKGIPAFGAMKDQNELAPDTVVTGPVWDMRPTVQYIVDQVKKGAYQAQDLKDFSMIVKGGASLAPYHGWEEKLPQDVKDLVKQRLDEIISGKFRVDINESDPAKK
jgi:basic membrane lipoprotein Med (substrate-binding protein (PBP1-ABC) superfamily)